MKALTLALFTAVLASCTKDDRSVTYSATCDDCTLWYKSDLWTDNRVEVDGSWSVRMDTVIVGPDTTYVPDSTRVLGTWSIPATLAHDERPIIRAVNNCGSTLTRIGVTEGGSSRIESAAGCDAVIAIN